MQKFIYVNWNWNSPKSAEENVAKHEFLYHFRFLLELYLVHDSVKNWWLASKNITRIHNKMIEKNCCITFQTSAQTLVKIIRNKLTYTGTYGRRKINNTTVSIYLLYTNDRRVIVDHWTMPLKCRYITETCEYVEVWSTNRENTTIWLVSVSGMVYFVTPVNEKWERER